MKHSKPIVRFREVMRRAIRLLDRESNRDCEYNIARRHDVGEGIGVLDAGGCGSLLPLALAKRGAQVTVYDFRKNPEDHPNLSTIQGDFLRNNLPESVYDYVVMISTIEHIGFGSYGAPIHEDGDLMAMSQAKHALKPNGKIVITLPFTGEHRIVPGFERWYDVERG